MNQPTDRESSITAPHEPLPESATGGIAQTADAGLSDHLQRSTERKDDPAVGTASTGHGATGGDAPRSDLGGKNEPGSAPGGSGPTSREVAPHQGASARDTGSAGGTGSAGTAGRGAPAGRGASTPGGDAATTDAAQAPAGQVGEANDENALEGIGRAVSEVVTGSVDTAGTKDRRY